jgi:hypothetical protein
MTQHGYFDVRRREGFVTMGAHKHGVMWFTCGLHVLDGTWLMGIVGVADRGTT